MSPRRLRGRPRAERRATGGVGRDAPPSPSSEPPDDLTFRGPTKADQAGEGFSLWLGPRAAGALDAWAAAAGLESGPVFRAVGRWGRLGERALTGRQVARIYRHRAEAAGLDRSRVSGHSPRAGLVTEAGRQGIPLQEVMQVSRHSDPRTALRCHRQGSALHNRAAGLAG